MTNAFANFLQASSSQRRRLRERILDEDLVDRSSLDRLLKDVAGTKLEIITANNNLLEQFDDALDWLSKEKLIGKFCAAVVAEWPDRANPLTEFFKTVLSEARSAESMRLRNYIHLFDRIDQETVFTNAVCQIPEGQPAPPVVVLISGVFEDEVDLMLDRILKKSLQECYLDPPQKRVPYVLEMTPAATALGLFRQLAGRVLGKASPRESFEVLLKGARERIAGQLFKMWLRSEAVTQNTANVLDEFFGYWSQLGSHPLPPFLFLLAVRDDPAAAAPAVNPADWFGMIGGACARHGASVLLIDHLMLAECRSDDISNWIDVLASDVDDLDFVEVLARARTVLDRSHLVTEQRPFRLRKIKTVLDEHL